MENALQKVYFYKKDSLDIDYVLDFEEINVRLLSIHPSGKYAYMNTELTNEVFEWVDCLSNYYTKAEIDTMLSTE